MLTFDKFSGINNVLPTQRLKPGELRTALNVDIGLDNEISRRSGYSVVNEDCNKNLHQGDGFMLATTDGDLKAIGGSTLYQSLGVDRVWYCNLPNGKTLFSNGLIHGVTDGVTASGYGIPIPDSLGAAADVAGSLFAGDYQYQLTYVRLSDGLEGGPLYSNPFPVVLGGVSLVGLPVLDGYAINVYLTSHNAGQGYYAGATLTDEFSYTGVNAALVLPCRTDFLSPPPVGILHAFWRGRVLLADGDTLWASRTHQHELFDKKKDFKRFSAEITLIQPVDDGVYVGTDDELLFLSGTEFDKLQQIRVMRGAVVLGSGVTVPGKLLKLGDGVGSGQAMVGIADRVLVAGFSGGQAVRLTEGRYVTTATEVAATFRMVDDIPQYLASVLADNALVAPANVVAPVVSGNLDVGDTLSCTSGTWTGTPTPTLTYQWYLDGSLYVGATSTTFIIPAGAESKFIYCRVTGTNSAGTASANSNTETVNAAAFSPHSLFANNEQGVFYDFSDLSTMFQDAAGTTPVTAAGQTVGKILDKSGRGNHATQATTSKRPQYQTDGTYHWLQFDGTDDALATGSINFTATDKMSAFVGARKTVDDVNQIIFEAYTDASVGVGTFSMSPSLGGGGNNAYFYAKQALGARCYAAITAPATFVATQIVDFAQATQALALQVKVNGVVPSLSYDGSVPGTGNFGNYPMNIGARNGGSLYFSGKLYSLICRGAASTAQEITDTETWVNEKTGAF